MLWICINYTCCIQWMFLNTHTLYSLYLMECFEYALNIRVAVCRCPSVAARPSPVGLVVGGQYWPGTGKRLINRVYFSDVPWTIYICYINGHHKQYILVDTIFNYIFHFGLQGNVFKTVRKIHLLDAGSAGAQKVCFEDLNKAIFLEVQNETCS